MSMYLKTYSIKDRLSKVDVNTFARPYQKGNSLQQFVADLPDSSIRTGGNRIALWNFLIQARANAQSGNTDQAMKKLQQALERTDGCVLRGAPDTKTVAPLAKAVSFGIVMRSYP